jgi:hypothetical protein
VEGTKAVRLRESEVLSTIVGIIGIAAIFGGVLSPPEDSSIGVEDGLGPLLGLLLIASPYLFFILWVRRWGVALVVGAAILLATTLILVIVLNDEHSTAALGLLWLPVVLYPLALIGRALSPRETAHGEA